MTWVVWAAALAGLGVGCVEESAPPEDDATWQQAASVCADGETVPGIDVSKWQGAIDWERVAGDGVVFAFVRVSHGVGIRDEYYDANWAGTRQNGIIRGTYQYFSPDEDPVAQADLLLDRMGPLEPGDLPPVIDVEEDAGRSPAQIADAVQRWLDRVEGALGVKPIIYTGPYFWRTYVHASQFHDYPLWLAHYGPACPDVPETWDDWTIHQTGSTGRVAGISGNVDTNLFNGSLAALMAMTVGDPVCGDGICHGQESHDTCPGDCPICEPVPVTGRIIDETDLCFFGGGNPQYLRRVAGGWDGSLIWTHATASSQAANYGLWDLSFEQPGEYQVEVYIDPAWAESVQSRYDVLHDGQQESVLINQATSSGWTSLGAFTFAAGPGQHLRIDDNTGEDSSLQRQIVLDAVRLTPTFDSPDDDAGMDDGGEDDGGMVDGGEDDIGSPDATDDAGSPDVSTPDSATDDVQADLPSNDDAQGEGEPDSETSSTENRVTRTSEGCTVSGSGRHSSAPTGWLVTALALLAWTRLRRR